MSESLFIRELKAADELYAIYRYEEQLSVLRTRIEGMWEIYEPYGDKDFRTKLSEDFDARYWEMHLTSTLIDEGYQVVSKQGRARGPDIQIQDEYGTICVQAVAQTHGAEPSDRSG